MAPQEPRVQVEPLPGRWHTPVQASPVLERLCFAGAGLSGACVLLGLVLRLPPLGSLGMVAGLLFSHGASLSKRIPPRSLRSRGDAGFRLENPDDLDVCLVDLCIASLGRPSRWDQGAAWFEDGRLLFSGLHTSFIIGGEDVLPRDEWKAFDSPDHGSSLPSNAVPLRAAEWVYVAFSPITRIEGGRSFERELRFRKGLARFRDEPPTSEGPRQLPPFAS